MPLVFWVVVFYGALRLVGHMQAMGRSSMAHLLIWVVLALSLTPIPLEAMGIISSSLGYGLIVTVAVAAWWLVSAYAVRSAVERACAAYRPRTNGLRT